MITDFKPMRTSKTPVPGAIKVDSRDAIIKAIDNKYPVTEEDDGVLYITMPDGTMVPVGKDVYLYEGDL